jgi:biopolymer transport protein ExbD
MATSLLAESDDDGGGEVIVEMNTTPLIDVMLVLLIMLIITIPIQTHAVKLNMPTSSAAAVTEQPKVVEVAVSSTGQITWDGSPVADRNELEARITEAAKLEPQPEVHLRPDRSAKYEVVAMVLASSQRLGLTKLGVTGNEQFVEP